MLEMEMEMEMETEIMIIDQGGQRMYRCSTLLIKSRSSYRQSSMGWISNRRYGLPTYRRI